MSTAALWLTVVGLGLYHGLNPAMGWPLAVANGLAQGRAGAVFATLLPLGAGHFMAVALVLLPSSALAWLGLQGQAGAAIRIAAGLIVLLFGVFKLLWPRHPRMLARIPPTRLAWWSFLMASTHGAGLMLLPFMLGLCSTPALDTAAATDAGSGHAALLGHLAGSSLVTAVGVALVHALANVLAGLAMAWLVYRYLGLGFLRRAWLNLDAVWGASLVLTGAAGILLP